jgi:4-alpha-glucanotransferase
VSRAAELRRLADRLGIVPSYRDMAGAVRVTSIDTQEALAASMGFPCDGPTGPRERLAELEAAATNRLLEPVAVTWSDAPSVAVTVRVRLANAAPGHIEWQLRLSLEDGTTATVVGSRHSRGAGETARIRLPHPLPWGYHQIDGTIHLDARRYDVHQRLIVAPSSCHAIMATLGSQRTWGLVANLYSVRSARNWGVGDIGDLRGLVGLVAEHGGAFVGLNPLHATPNAGHGVSPYSPLSRVFRNPLYVDVAGVPEWRDTVAGQQSMALPSRSYAHGDHGWIDYDAVFAAKREALHSCHERFAHVSEHHPHLQRVKAYDTYRRRHSNALEPFATFMALADRFGTDWRAWPPRYRSCDSAAVEKFRRAHHAAVDSHRYLQFELDRQLGNVGTAARTSLAVGLYGDLALGSALGGADTWSWPSLFASEARLGAPPDDYSATGQDWGLPPLRPHALRQSGHRYWIDVVRSAMRHVGALRLDHVMGLFRQYWIPPERDGRAGAYVRFPAEELLAVLTLESRRNRVLVVGEDLGTVPRGLTNSLRRRGILSTRVLYFERDARGAYKSSKAYSARSIVTATTHDHPPLSGFWHGRDLDLRADAGSLDRAELEQAHAERHIARSRLRKRLAAEGFPVGADPAPEQLAAAVYGFLARTPAPLLGIALDDLTGETVPVNLPGLGMDRYRSWSRRLGVALEHLDRSSIVRAVLQAVSRAGRTSR